MTAEHKPHMRQDGPTRMAMIEHRLSIMAEKPSGRAWLSAYQLDVKWLLEQLETLRECVRDYADPDSWNHVRSPDTGTAWEKVGGHPTPWVDAQHALDAVSFPASVRGTESKP